jgi:hypothetical protein
MRTMSETGGAYQPTHSDLDPSKPPQGSGLLAKETYDVEEEIRRAMRCAFRGALAVYHRVKGKPGITVMDLEARDKQIEAYVANFLREQSRRKFVMHDGTDAIRAIPGRFARAFARKVSCERRKKP